MGSNWVVAGARCAVACFSRDTLSCCLCMVQVVVVVGCGVVGPGIAWAVIVHWLMRHQQMVCSGPAVVCFQVQRFCFIQSMLTAVPFHSGGSCSSCWCVWGPRCWAAADDTMQSCCFVVSCICLYFSRVCPQPCCRVSVVLGWFCWWVCPLHCAAAAVTPLPVFCAARLHAPTSYRACPPPCSWMCLVVLGWSVGGPGYYAVWAAPSAS